MNARRLDYPTVTRLLARTLKMSREELEASFVPARLSDLDALVDLRSTHEHTGHRPNDREYLQWRYDLSGSDPDRSLWVFRRRGEIVGTLGVGRDTFTYRNRNVQVHMLMDILAREDHMGLGLGAWMHLFAQRRFENTFALGSTPYSHSIMATLSEELPDWQTWRYPISVRRRNPALVVVDALLGLKRRLFRSFVLPGARLVVGDECLKATEPLRDSMSQHLIMPLRDTERAHWRFDEHPYVTYAHYGLVHEDEPIAVVTVSNRGYRADVVDALVRIAEDTNRSIRALASLFTLVISELAQEGAEVVTAKVNDPVTSAALRRAGFIRRDEPCMISCDFRTEELVRWIDGGVPLFLTLADSDLD